MSCLLGRGLLLAMLSAGLLTTAQAGPTLVKIPTPRGVTQSFILITPERPVASVILFAGEDGALGLESASSMKRLAETFLVRTRNSFADHHFAVAVVDTPSDRPEGMSAVFRMSDAHADDIDAVAAYLKKQAAVPVWLVGTSMGTFSAAGGAIAAKDIDGLVLTSTITHSASAWAIAKSHADGVASMALAKVAGPTLIVSHRKDACEISPPAGAPKHQGRLVNAAKVEVAVLDGGDRPQSGPCEPKSAHGFFGIEAKAVDTIAKFIGANSK